MIHDPRLPRHDAATDALAPRETADTSLNNMKIHLPFFFLPLLEMPLLPSIMISLVV